MNKVIHFEIATDDVARAKKFYQDVFGWQIMDMPGMQYSMVTTTEVDENHKPKEAGAINGGMYKRTQPNEASSIVISVPSIEEHLKLIESAGGKILVTKQAVGDMGFYARIQDTEENIVGLWENIEKAA